MDKPGHGGSRARGQRPSNSRAPINQQDNASGPAVSRGRASAISDTSQGRSRGRGGSAVVAPQNQLAGRAVTTQQTGGRAGISQQSGGRASTSQQTGGRASTSQQTGGRAGTSQQTGAWASTLQQTGAWGGTSQPTGAWASPLQQSAGRDGTSQQAAGRAGTSQQTGGRAGLTTAPTSVATVTEALGRATLHREQEPNRGDNGGNSRGATRGRRQINDIIKTRPVDLNSKRGTSGTEVTLQANYFRALRRPNWTLYQYRVDFAPEIDLIRVRSGIIYANRDKFGGYIFDGNQLFTTKEIPSPLEFATKNRNEEVIKITIKHVGVIETCDAQSLQILNLILRKSMEGLQLQLVGRNLYDALNKIEIRQYRLELWPGYITSFRQHEADILLCAEISHKVMRTDTLLDILRKLIRECRTFQEEFKREVIGMVVLTDYNNKTYRVDDVDFNMSPSSKFATRDGEISFVEYYKKRYNINIRDKEQPLLISKSTERNLRAGQSPFIMLVPELCRATGINEAMKNNFQVMRAMGDHTRLSPSLRIERLIAFNRRLFRTPASMETLNSWQLTLDQNLVEFSGRVLAMEKVIFGNGKNVDTGPKCDWTGELRNLSMFSNVPLKKWFVIVPQKFRKEAEDFVKLIIQAARGFKMEIAMPAYNQLPEDKCLLYSKAIEECTKQDIQLLFCVVFNKNAERYSTIKRKTCITHPCASQVVVLKTITPKPGKNISSLISIATKVAIQMNAKLGGVPWSISLPLGGLMTIGFDVCHSNRDRAKSYGAMVATMDMRTCSSFFSSCSEHVKGAELSNDITVMVSKAIRQYREIHNTLPQRILFYRDGVGDGQLHQVIEHEVQVLKSRLKEIYKDADIKDGLKFAFIVVSKRINTRLFVNKDNPRPGTVADDVITLPERYDFFLVSQSVMQGTVSPTSYNIIESQTFGLSADRIQVLTYKYCHLYYNWSGSTRVPSLCQYAHKLAFLVANNFYASPSTLLEKKLYFL